MVFTERRKDLPQGMIAARVGASDNRKTRGSVYLT